VKPVGDFLWQLFYGESTGIKVAMRLSQDPFFTQAERREWGRISSDEARHAAIVLSLARKFKPYPDEVYESPKFPADQREAIVRLSRHEGLLLRGYNKSIRPRLNEEEAAAFDTIWRDEVRHRAFGRALLKKYGGPPKQIKVFGPDFLWRNFPV
jgi:rubrerythrin